MNISLTKATLSDAEILHEMQVKSFMPLLEKYQDYETNPANETIENISARINHISTDYYIIRNNDNNIGGIRIVKKDNSCYRISPIFILPEFQGRGVAQKVFKMIETMYSDAKIFELDTILQEQNLCHLYEKLGYKKTGQTHFINSNMTLIFYEKHTQH